MRLRAFLLVLLFISIVLPLPTHGDSEDCSGAPPTRLTVGQTARTTFTSASGIRLYENPGERSHRVAVLGNGTALNVVGGPTCTGSMQWWQVRTRTGLAGWIGEGDADTYQLEPWPLAVGVVQRQPQHTDEIRLVQVRPDGGIARILNRFPVQPVHGSVREVFRQAEWSPLQAALDTVLAHCPALAPVRSFEQWSADSGASNANANSMEMDVYPSPDGARLLVVRHLWHRAPTCSPGSAPVYGLDRLSLISLSGEITLLDVPANAPGPIYLDRFPYQPPQASARSRIEGVWWSPDTTKAALQIRYADLSNPALPVFTYKVMVYDLASGTAADLGDGLHPSWDLTGERVQWFRRISPQIDLFDGEALYSAKPDGSDLRGIPLPANSTFVTPVDAPLLPWNETGRQVVACTGANNAAGCTTVSVFDLVTRNLSMPVGIAPVLEPKGYRAVWWLNESTLIWLPADPAAMTLYLESVQTGVVTPFHLKTSGTAQYTLVDARPFPDGQTIFVTVQDDTGVIRYLTVNVGTGKVMTVQMPS